MAVTVLIWVVYALALLVAGRPASGVAASRLLLAGVLAGRRRPSSDPLRGVKLALVGVSHHQAPIELRERVAVDLDAARVLARRSPTRTGARRSSSRPATAPSSTSRATSAVEEHADGALL